MPPACGLSHCSLRPLTRTLVVHHIVTDPEHSCGADLFARSAPHCMSFVGSADRQETYLTVTVAPAASSLALASSAASLPTFSSSGLGALSTRSLASLRPRPETISRTTLMTPIFFSPAPSRTTSNSDCSSAASAGAPAAAPGAAATATGAAAVTSKVSSNFLTNSESSSSVSSLNASSRSSVDSLAMVWSFLILLLGYLVVLEDAATPPLQWLSSLATRLPAGRPATPER